MESKSRDPPELCRACTKKLQSDKIIKLKSQLLEKFVFVSSLQVHEADGLPKQLCEECNKLVEDFYTFRLLCAETERKLKGLLSDKSVPGSVSNNLIKREVTDLDVNYEAEFESHQKRGLTKRDEEDEEDASKNVKSSNEYDSDSSGEETDFLDEEDVEFPRTSLGPKYKCPRCGKRLHKRRTYVAHMKEHMGLKPCKCKACGEVFDDFVRFDYHTEKHRPKLTCSYEDCGKIYSSKPALRAHQRNFHGLDGGPRKNSTDLSRKNEPHPCEHCGRVLANKRSYQNHVLLHSNDKPFTCNECNKKFPTIDRLKAHIQRHVESREYDLKNICNDCGQDKNRKDPVIDVPQQIEGEQTCEFCPLKFTTLANLNRHISKKHNNVRPYACTYCERAFSKAEHLSGHVITHTNIRCRTCGKYTPKDKTDESTKSNSELQINKTSSTADSTAGPSCMQQKFDSEDDDEILDEFSTQLTPKAEKSLVQNVETKVGFEMIPEFIDSGPPPIIVGECVKVRVKLEEAKEEKAGPDAETKAALSHNAEIQSVCLLAGGGAGDGSIAVGGSDIKNNNSDSEKGDNKDEKYSSSSNSGNSDSSSSSGSSSSDSSDEDSDNVSRSKKSKTRKTRNNGYRPVQPKFQCEECGKRLLSQTTYDAHLRVHKGLKPCLCQICGAEFDDWKKFYGHRDTHKNKDRFKCPSEGCNRAYRRKHTLKHHILTHHSDISKQEKLTYICEHCGKNLATRQSLLKHYFTHTGQKDFHCKQCPKSYSSQYRLNIHLKRHMGIKEFVCSVCGLRKTTKQELTLHFKTHTRENERRCEYCSKVYSSNANLKLHIETVHKGIKKYSCQFCGRGFGKSDHLKHHEMIHTQDRPHVCNICGKGYIQATALRTHMEAHGRPTKPRKRRRNQKVEEEEEASFTETAKTTPTPTVSDSQMDDNLSNVEAKLGSVETHPSAGEPSHNLPLIDTQLTSSGSIHRHYVQHHHPQSQHHHPTQQQHSLLSHSHQHQTQQQQFATDPHLVHHLAAMSHHLPPILQHQFMQ